MASSGESIAGAICVLPRAMRWSVARSSTSDPAVRSYTRSTRRSSDEPLPSVAIARERRSASRMRIAAKASAVGCPRRLTRAISRGRDDVGAAGSQDVPVTSSGLNRISGGLLVLLALLALVLFADIASGLGGLDQPPLPDEGTQAHVFQLAVAAIVPTLVLF